MKSSCIDFVRLDFEGGLHGYRNAELGMDVAVPVAPSGIAPERRERLAEKLNQADGKVRFVLDGVAASTIHIGKSNAFDAYGRFLGLAEGIGQGDAFVLLDDNASDEQLLTVIRHEAGHILGTLDHGGAGLARYGYLHQEYDYFFAPDPENSTRRIYLKRQTTTRYEIHELPATSSLDGLCLQAVESGTEIYYEYSSYERSYNEETHQWYWETPATEYIEYVITLDVCPGASDIWVGGSIDIYGASASNCIADGSIIVYGSSSIDKRELTSTGLGFDGGDYYGWECTIYQSNYHNYKGSATDCKAKEYLIVQGDAEARNCEAKYIRVSGSRDIKSQVGAEIEYATYIALVDNCTMDGGTLQVGYGAHAKDVVVKSGEVIVGDGDATMSMSWYSNDEKLEMLGYGVASNLRVESGKVTVKKGGRLHNADIKGTLKVGESSASLSGIINCTALDIHAFVPQVNITVKLDLRDYAIANSVEYNRDENRSGTVTYYYANYTCKTEVWENNKVISVVWDNFDNKDGLFDMSDWKYTFDVDIGAVDAAALPYITVDFGGTEKDFDSGTLHFAYPSTTHEIQFNMLTLDRKKWEETWEGEVSIWSGEPYLMACTLNYNPALHGEAADVLWLSEGEDASYNITLDPVMSGATSEGEVEADWGQVTVKGTTLTVQGETVDSGKTLVTAEDASHRDLSCDLELMVVPETLPVIGKKGAQSYASLLKKAQKEHLTTITAALPCDPELALCGMKFKMSDLAASLTVNWTQPSITLKLQGKLEWTFRKDKTLTIDLSGDNYFSVIHSGKQTSWDIVGQLTVPDFHIGRFGFSGVYIAVNKAANSVAAGGEVTLPCVGISLKGDFSIVDGYIDSVGLGVGNLNTPLGATGLMLQSIYGSISGIATSVDMTFGGTLGLSYGPVLEINWDLDWLGLEDGEYSLCTMEVGATISTSGEITGTASVDCLGGFISGLGEVSGSSGSISVTGSFSMLKDAITITGVMTSNTGGVTISGEGRMQVPKSDYFGWLGGTGLSVTVFANLGDKNTPLAQRYILAWEEITFFGNKFTVGFKCNFEGHVELLGNSDLLGGDELFGSKGPGLVAHSVASPGDNGDMPTASETCTISDFGVTLFQFNFTVSSAWASLSYGGVEYTQGEISSGQYGNMQIVDELSDDSRLTIAVNNAGLGEWTLNAYGDYGATFGAYALTGVAPSPVIDAVELGDDARSATINYSLADLSALENAVVSIFMDEADSGDYSGMLIGQFAAEEATGSYEYALDDEMNGGNYAFYVMVSSDNYAPVFSELSDVLSFRYLDNEAPDQIQQVDAEWRSTGTVLTWNEPYDNVGVAGYKVAYRVSEEDEWSEADIEIASFVFADVPNGTYAYRVAAYDAEGNLAAWSEEGSVLVNLAANATCKNATIDEELELATYEGVVNVTATETATMTTSENSLVSGSTLGNAEIHGIVEDSVINGNTTLLAGGIGSNLTVNGTLKLDGSLEIEANPFVNEPVEKELAIRVTANGVIVNDGGTLVVGEGAVVSGVTVNSGGALILQDGAEYYDLALDYGSTLAVAGGGKYLLTDDIRIAGTLNTHGYINANGHKIVFEQYKQTAEYQFFSSGRINDEVAFTYDLDKLLGYDLEIEIDSSAYGVFMIADKADYFDGTLQVTDHASGYTATVGFDEYTVVGNALCRLRGGLYLETLPFSIDAPTVTVRDAENDSSDTVTINVRPADMDSGSTVKRTFRYSLNEDMSDAVEVVNENVLQKSDLIDNATYYVQACTESNYGAVSPWSDVVSFTVVSRYHLPTPTLSIEYQDGFFVLTANGVDDLHNGDVRSLNFVYGLDPEMSEGTSRTINIANGNQLRIDSYELAEGRNFYVQVRTLGRGAWSNFHDEYSDWSNMLVFKNGAFTPEGVQTLAWMPGGEGGYVFECSADGFQSALRINVASTLLDTFAVPLGDYQWRVRPLDGGDWSEVQTLFADENFADGPRLTYTNDDGVKDVFFAKASGTWEEGFMARHTGCFGGWTGTREGASIAGKNRLADVIEGWEDANILLMTDDANGDALFVDDIYSALPLYVWEQQSRLQMINEIRAGAGDDVVDLTSQRFAYVGSGMTVRGGLGNDVIWANGGSNWLFGDAGDDRLVGASGDDVLAGGAGNDSLHGGGGDDVFTFGGNWGKDTVQQLADGGITLWFEENTGSWNAETLTYTDGDNSVQVIGECQNITLRFGNEDEQYASLQAAGAFSEATSEKIFEDRGMLA